MMKKKNNLKKTILKASISIILIVFLLFKIKLSEIIGVIKEINIAIFLLSIPVFLLLYIVRAIKWNFLLKKINVKLRFLELMKIFIIGIFYGMVTPGKAGELARAYYIKEKKAKVIPTIIIDKLNDIFSLFILSLLTVVLFFNNKTLVYAVLIVGFSLTIALLLLISKKTISLLCKAFKIEKSHEEEYIKNMNIMFKNKITIFKNFMHSLIFYGLSFIAAYFILKSMNPGINLLVVLTLPLIILLGNAPFTISGLGLREFITVLAFQRFNEPASLGFSFSLIWFIMITVIPGLIGYMFILKR